MKRKFRKALKSRWVRAYILMAIIFMPLHNMATAQRNGVIAFGGEAIFCIIAPYLFFFIADTIKAYYKEQRKRLGATHL